MALLIIALGSHLTVVSREGLLLDFFLLFGDGLNLDNLVLRFVIFLKMAIVRMNQIVLNFDQIREISMNLLRITNRIVRKGFFILIT